MTAQLAPWDLDCGDCGYPLWYGQTCPRCGWDEDDGSDDDRDDDDGWWGDDITWGPDGWPS